MSIIASVKVYDGLVLAADSMTNIYGQDVATGQTGIVIAYEYAQKIFQLASLPIIVATYGIGNIGTRSIESLLFEFSKEYEEDNARNKKVKHAANALLEFLKKRYYEIFDENQINNNPTLGFYIGGYSPDSIYAEDYEFVFPSLEEVKEVREADHFGASWRGISIPFTRLFRGIDPRYEDSLIKNGVEEELVKNLHKAFESPFVFNGMPVQDAIDLASFIVGTTIGLARFEAGPVTCGGPVDIAVAHPNGTFQWIKRKKLEHKYNDIT